jgi:predicted nucleic acid-binding protein
MKAMNAKVFIDSNIWLYALIDSQNDQTKHQQAKKRLAKETNVVISTQVVNEVCVNLIRKANKDSTYISQFIRDFTASYKVMGQDKDDLILASTLRQKYHFSYWDSLIVASATKSGCQTLYSEDMQDGLVVFEKLQILNPLLEADSHD